ncbi:MAG TPA: cytochrome c-type biogenesis CcmF C-terminal domain-containing protein [Polyangiaceae bacterium]|nr:cytochrome c-type biogenesis CcmF C-terminal domain-containing protein [Polyangiaceae bacterium]
MWQSLPLFGKLVLDAVMIAAAYTFAVSVVAGRGKPRFLQAARLGAYGTVALIGLAILCLAYAFVTHDFRIKYVAHYSDRSMTTPYLLTALWGGQDGSLLWWLFLLSIYSGVCVRWMRGRFRELQPYVIATLMVIVLFFCVLMTFAANPFSTSIAGARVDGEGLNPLLQNFYMIIHPPSLYTGFVGCSVPFAFATAALVTGRLDNEWIAASRNWMLFAWLFLSIGNALGMLWAYEELGWGGYWAWDPVENAAFLPWLTATAYVHSMMIQERRGMLKVWNVSLVLTTFFLTIFGTFLTRSGLIASVHSFAQSNIGIYFVWFLGMVVAASAGLVVWRLPRMRSEGRIEAVLSREAAFLANNWGLLGIMVFILVATTFPRISEWLMNQQSSVGPTFYNAWLPPLGLFLFALMGMGPLLGWRKTSPQMFKRGFFIPVGFGIAIAILHVLVGKALRFPPFVTPDRIYEGVVGTALQKLGTVLPLVSTFLCAFNIAVVIQEYTRGIQARRRAGKEPFLAALVNLVAKARHRYGGYIVHVGIVLMFFGFTGRSWGVDKEISMKAGETIEVDHYSLKYVGPRMEVDQTKRMIFADLAVTDVNTGEAVGKSAPAKFIYRKMPESPTTEVSMLHTIRDDLYVVVGTVSAESKVATFQIHINPFVSFIWIGVLVLMAGAVITMWPEVAFQEAGAGWSYLRMAGGLTSSILFGVMLALMPARAFGQQNSSSSLHAGTVEIRDPTEHALFSSLLCQCGDCPRLPLSSCTCSTADATRSEIRSRLHAGATIEDIRADYVREHGAAALSVPPNTGALRAIYMVPGVIGVGGLGFVLLLVRRWKKRGEEGGPTSSPSSSPSERDEYDAKLDEELKKLDG